MSFDEMEMEALRKLQMAVNKVTYKPHHEISVVSFDNSYVQAYGPRQVLLQLRTTVPSVDSGEPIKLTFSKAFTLSNFFPMSIEHIVKYALLGLVRDWEMHEMNEWFKYEGKFVVNPHPESKEHEANSVSGW